MKDKVIYHYTLVCIYFRWSVLFASFLVSSRTQAQETVFALLQTDVKRANAYYAAKNYRKAAALYESIGARSKSDRYYLVIARSYYYGHQPKDAATWYEKFLSEDKTLPMSDLFSYAETLSTLKQYDRAIEFYTQYQSLNSNDPLVMKKIWQLKNKEYLFEDSAHYTVKQLATNSTSSDFCAVLYGQGFVFLSNRKNYTVVQQTDERDEPFFRLYYSGLRMDTVNSEITITYSKPVSFGKTLTTPYQQGPVAFYAAQKRMAYIVSGEPSAQDRDKRTLQLFFAELEDKTWKIKGSFPHNNREYSISAATIREDGNVLYFASDMPGGFGGNDLYVSTLINGEWSKPANLGAQINTSRDESYPCLHGNNLYFTSNGHAGLGGLDIFRTPIGINNVSKIENLGYPINTNFDDFAISLSADGAKGYISSDRIGHTDDIYELTIDLQSYPFSITGVLKYKEESWRDSAELKTLPNAKLFLIDNLKNTVVQTCTADASGIFSFSIPYFSQYRIKVADKDGEETFVSLDLSKKRNADNRYEIVVVKNTFKKTY